MRRVERTYTLGDDDAIARLKALADYWRTKHGVNCEWSDSTARLVGRKLGVKYDATVVVGAGVVVVEVEVGLLAEKLGGPRYVERKVDEYLDPSHSIESLRARIPT